MSANIHLQHGRSDGVLDVVIPIYDAFDNLCACLDAVLANTDVAFRLILINDGSTDPRISALLDDVRNAAPGLVVIDRDKDNRGFVQTANEGLRYSGTNDVVLLNSDTVVSRGWLPRLARAAESRPNVATVTPLTNNGTLCSVPVPFADNPVPAGYDVDGLADLIAETSGRLYPEVPTGVGFCMLVMRHALDAVGLFDDAAFGRGYGEENDFCQRAIAAGFVNLIADDAFVFHRGQGSFGPETAAVLERHIALVESRHTAYGAAIRDVIGEHPLASYQRYLARCIARGRSGAGVRAGLRVLHLLHSGGGTEKHARELAQSDDPDLMHFVSLSDGASLTIDEYFAGEIMRHLQFPMSASVPATDPRPLHAYRDALSTACVALGIRLIHVHHLRHNTADVTQVAAALGIPYLVTIHDYHVVCPQYTLLDPNGDPCGACLQQPPRSVDRCMRAHGECASYLGDYQAVMENLLRGAADIVVPNVTVRALVSGRYPDVGRAAIVEHGHRLNTELGPRERLRPRDRRVLHAAVIGGLERHKGGDLLRDLLARNTSSGIVFHLYGTTADPDLDRRPLGAEVTVGRSRFVYHGPYDSAVIEQRLRADGIDVGLHLSVWPETFSYTLSEFAAAGIPVIADASGAQGERVQRGLLGWAMPDIRDAVSTLLLLKRFEQQPELLTEARSYMRSERVLKPLRISWLEYSSTYRRLAASPSQMKHRDEQSRRVDPGYVSELAMKLAHEQAEHRRLWGELQSALAHVAGLEELLRSPRHRVATFVSAQLQRIPVVWPLIARATEAFIRRAAKDRTQS